MTVNFAQYPTSNRVPGVFAEIDPSKANSARQNLRTLIIGQITSTGTAPPNLPIISSGVGDAQVKGGPGSMLALITALYRQGDGFGEVWYLPLADDGSAVAATGTITYSAAPTGPGVHSLYIAGLLVSVAVTATMTAIAVAAAVVAAVNANISLPVTAAQGADPNDNRVTFTAKNKGLTGNDIDIRTNYQGSLGGEADPPGLAYTIVAMASGATNPVLTTALANLSDMPFEFIVFPYNDATSLNAMKAFLDDSTGRWSWQKMLYGHAIAAFRGTFGAATTLGVSRNDQHVSIMPFDGSPTPAWLWAAAIAAQVAVSVRADPALPFNTLALPGVLSPPIAKRFDISERNTLLYDGLSSFTVDDDGTVRIERLVTTYQKNASGVADDAYLNAERPFTLAFVNRDLRIFLLSQFGRKVLVSDTTRIPQGSNRINAQVIRAAIIARYRKLEGDGMVQNSEAFAKALVVENAGAGLVKVQAPEDLANQLEQIAILVQFRAS